MCFGYQSPGTGGGAPESKSRRFFGVVNGFYTLGIRHKKRSRGMPTVIGILARGINNFSKIAPKGIDKNNILCYYNAFCGMLKHLLIPCHFIRFGKNNTI